MRNNSVTSIIISIAMLFAILLIGGIGYTLIEDYKFFDAIYMTVITISTVGFEEVRPLSDAGELFTIFMIIFSFGFYAYAVTNITRFMVDGEFRNHFVNRRTNRKVAKLSDHVVLCGYGRNGSEAARTLKLRGIPFVIVDNNASIINEIRRERKYLYFQGDATDDNTLLRAGLNEAKSLITTLPKDADNLLVVLSARSLNKELQIISRASMEWSDMKYRAAGANNVIMPDMVGGRRMAKLVASPDIVSFLEYMNQKRKGEPYLAELNCKDFCKAVINKTIGELKFKKISGVNIIGLKDEDGNYIFNPGPEVALKESHRLIVMGSTLQLDTLKAEIYN